MIFNLKKDNKKTVFVGLSGGVDSSVAALRLKKRGFNVVGVFIKVWQPDFLECDSEKDRLDAMRAAAHLDIPFLTLDAAKEYKQGVGDYFVNEYLKGRTPNPDVMCNRYVKFGVFWDFAKAHGADYIATGHYARIREEASHYRLERGADPAKDQSYFLWTLTKDDLSHVLFPVGDSLKEEIRKEAKEAGLLNAERKDSQGICFLGHVDIPDFLSHFVSLKEGKVLDKSGKEIGTHQGALVYTIGQRHGFEVKISGGSTTPHYVIAKDVSKNTITVDTKTPEINKGEQIKLEGINWLGENTPEQMQLEAQFRYRQKPIKVELKKNAAGWQLNLLENTSVPDSGQSVVFYQEDELLGGGVVS